MIVTLTSISTKAARDMIASAIEEAEALKLFIAVVVTDPHGHEKLQKIGRAHV